MVVNFKARKISRGTHKLTRTPTFKKRERERERDKIAWRYL
jgi:hypothetical protein